MKLKLTEASVKAAGLKPNGGQNLVWDADLKCFGLLVSRDKVKSFCVQVRGTRRTLGRWPALSVAAARTMAHKKIADLSR